MGVLVFSLEPRGCRRLIRLNARYSVVVPLTLTVVLSIGNALTGQGIREVVPSFRSAVNILEIDVLVTDEDGRFVRDLTEADFEVVEDGRLQDLQSVSLVNLPLPERLENHSPIHVRADVQTNSTPQDRIYVIVMDSPSTRPAPNFVGGGTYAVIARRIMRQFVEGSVGPNDLVAVVHTQGTFTDSQPFTTDRQLIVAAIDRYGTGLSGDYSSGSTAQLEERVTRQMGTYRTLQDVAERLGAMSGRRKSLIWVGAQMMFALPDPDTMPEVCGSASARGCRYIRSAWVNLQAAYQDAIRTATRNNVAIYAVDPAGLTTELGAAELDRRSALMAVAEDTGGRSIVGSNDFTSGFAAIVRDNSTYYVLGYMPEPDHRDGKFHAVQVRVKRPGVAVRARKGYLAPTASSRPNDVPFVDDLAAATRRVLTSPIGLSGLNVELSTAAYVGEVREERSVVLVGRVHGSLRLDAKAQLAFGYQIFGKDGKVKAGELKALSLNLGPASLARARDTGLHFVQRVSLPPGAYEVRVAAHQPDGAAGSVVAPLNVPDFDAPLSLSGLTLATDASRAQLMFIDDKRTTTALGISATSLRRFRRDDTLSTYVEVYSNDQKVASRDISLRAMILDDAGREVMTENGSATAELSGRPKPMPFTLRLRLSGLAAGQYVLVVEATSQRRRGVSATRQIPFEITN